MQKPWEKYATPGGSSISYIPGPPEDPEELERQRLAAEAQRAAIENARLQAQRGMADVQTAPYDARKKVADAQKSEIDAAAAARDYARGPKMTETEIKLANDKQQDARKTAVIRQQIQVVRDLFEQDMKGRNPLEYVDGIPAYQRFRVAGQNILPLIRPLVAASAKEGDSNKEMEIFESYIPTNDDTDEAIQFKITALERLIDGMDQGMLPSQYIAGQQQGQAAPSLNFQTGGPSGPAGGGPNGPPIPGPRQPPEQMDRTTVNVFEGGPGQLDRAREYITRDDPKLKGLNGEINSMIKRGASLAQVKAHMAKRGVPQNELGQMDAQWPAIEDARRKGYRGDYGVNVDDMSIPLTGWNKWINNRAQSPLGTYGMTAAQGVTFGTLDNMTSDPAAARAGIEYGRQQNPNAALAGAVSGGVLGAAGLEAGLGAAGLKGAAKIITSDLAYGSAAGAGNTDNGNRLLGAVKGAAAARVGGAVGGRVAAGLGKAASGVKNEAVRYAADRGIPLTVGQIAGRGGKIGRSVKAIEDALESVPFLGQAIKARRMEGYEAFNRQAFDEALEPIGGSAAGIGEQGVEQAQKSVSNAYDDALAGVTVDARPDKAFINGMKGAMNRGKRLPPDLRSHFIALVNNHLAPNLQNGTLTGKGYQALRQTLRQERAAVKGQLSAGDYSDILRQVERNLEGLIRRQAPHAVPALKKADAAYRRVKVLQDAVSRGKNSEGVFSPAQLGMSAEANAKRFDGTQGTTARPFFELQRNAQDLLPSNVPNSGTADRAWASMILPAAIGGGGAATGVIDPQTGALIAALGLPYTPQGAALAQKILIERPEILRNVGQQAVARQRMMGLFGAGSAAPLLLPSE